jgi:hypothetical protein
MVLATHSPFWLYTRMNRLIFIAAAFPIAGVWLYTFGLLVAIILTPVFPFILRHRRRRAKAELHEKIEKAIDGILADGVVSRPKGRYKPCRHHGARTSLHPYNETRPPRGNSYDGMPWN